MRFRNMLEFIVLSRTHSYWDAAEQLHISQGALSRHIMEMESELGVTLFDRSTRRVELSEYGVFLLPYAKRIIQIEEEYTHILAQMVDATNNTLTIGSVIGWNEREIAEMVTSYQVEHPRIRINMITDESASLLFKLKNNFFDFAFIREQDIDINDGLCRQCCYRDILTACLPVNHPLASSLEISLEQLKHEVFIMSDESSLSCLVGTQACRKAGFEPDILFKGSRHQTYNFLKKGLGIGLMFGVPDTRIRENNIIAIEVTPPICARINLVYQDSYMSEIKQDFLQFINSTGIY